MTAEKELTRTERRRQQTREKLIVAVRKLTAEKGVEAVTIRDLADEVDIAVGSFYSYFESKEVLLNEAAEELLTQFGDLIDALNSALEDPLEIITTAFTLMDKMAMSDPVIGWFVVRLSEYDSDFPASLFERFERDVTLGIEQGKFHVPDVPMAMRMGASSFLAFAKGRVQGHLGDDAVVHLCHLILRLLGADEEAARETAKKVWETLNP